MTRFIYYDTETTGVNPQQDEIIEIAAYDPQNELTFTKLINPKIPIPEEASRIHNITDDMVKSAPTFSVVAQEFSAFCEGDAILVAHNNDAFDQPFLEASYKRHQVDMPEMRFLDSLKWARKYRRDLPRHALQFLREVYGIEKNQAHRALDDVIVLHKVFSYMIGDLKPSEVVALLSQKSTVQRMPFGKHRGKHLKDVPGNYVSWLNDSGAFDKKENEELKAAFIKLGVLQTADVGAS